MKNNCKWIFVKWGRWLRNGRWSKYAHWKTIASGYLYNKGDDWETGGEANTMMWQQISIDWLSYQSRCIMQ